MIPLGFFGRKLAPSPFPANAAIWAISFPSIPVPNHIYTYQEASSSILDTVGSDYLSPSNLSYQNVDPIGRYAVRNTTSNGRSYRGNPFLDLTTVGSVSVFSRILIPSSFVSASGDVIEKISLNGYSVRTTTTGLYVSTDGSGGSAVLATIGNSHRDDLFHPLCMVIDKSADSQMIATDLGSASSAVSAGSLTATTAFSFGDSAAAGGGIVGMMTSYAAIWYNGADSSGARSLADFNTWKAAQGY